LSDYKTIKHRVAPTGSRFVLRDG